MLQVPCGGTRMVPVMNRLPLVTPCEGGVVSVETGEPMPVLFMKLRGVYVDSGEKHVPCKGCHDCRPPRGTPMMEVVR